MLNESFDSLSLRGDPGVSQNQWHMDRYVIQAMMIEEDAVLG
jgi:hypothetical protein